MIPRSGMIPMRPHSPSAVFRLSFLMYLGALLGLFLSAGTALAQPPLGNNLPNPRLMTVTPPGGKVGTTVEVTFVGTDLEETQSLLFSHLGIQAVLIQPQPP